MDELQARGERFREQVRSLVSPEEFAMMGLRFAATPGMSEDLADFWRQEQKRFGADPG
ncbi:MAG: hypothetical protein JWO38_6119 [Gemmataceae bacterium]|nr:hypothetical protein [Gemmataceae bacterium]